MIRAQMSTGQLLKIEIAVSISDMPGPSPPGSDTERFEPQSAGGVIGRIEPAAETGADSAPTDHTPRWSIEESIAAWRRDMIRLERNEKHIHQSVSTVRAFARVCSKRTVASVGPQDGMAYLQSLADADPPLSSRTIRNRQAQLKAWGEFLIAMEQRESNPFRPLKTPKVKPLRKTRAFTVDEVRRLIEVAQRRYESEDERSHRYGPLRPVFYLFLASTGLRREEASRQLWEDVHLDEGWLRVTDDKSKRNDVIGLSAELVESLRQWSEWRLLDLVFPQTVTPKTLVSDMKLAGIPGVQEGVHGQFHRFRRTAATGRLDQDGSEEALRNVMHLMRHVDLRTTLETYDRAPIGKLREAAELMPALMTKVRHFWRADGSSYPQRLGAIRQKPEGSAKPLDTATAAAQAIDDMIATQEHLIARTTGDRCASDGDHVNRSSGPAIVGGPGNPDCDPTQVSPSRDLREARAKGVDLPPLSEQIPNGNTLSVGVLVRVVESHGMEVARQGDRISRLLAMAEANAKGVCCGHSGVSGVQGR